MKKFILVTITISFLIVLIRYHKKKVSDLNSSYNIQNKYYNLCIKWLKINRQEKNISQYFKQRNYKNIGIYGLSEIGEIVYSDLINSDINIKFGIDQDVVASIVPIDDIYLPTDILPNVDVIIVTPIHDYDNIKETLKSKVNCPIVSLAEIIYNL